MIRSALVRVPLGGLFVATLLSAPTGAQEINIDVGGLAGSPPTSYGGDGLQPGVWNVVPADATDVPLVGLDGVPLPGRTITIQGGSELVFDHPDTNGGAAALFDDVARASGPLTITLRNTSGGPTTTADELIVYAWSPDAPPTLSTVRVTSPFGTAPEPVGGAWTTVAGDRWGAVYAWTPGSECDAAFLDDLVILVEPGPGSTVASLAGIQLVNRGLCGSNSFCNGFDGALAACPCQNRGTPTSGCDLAQGTGGVQLRLLALETSPMNRATLEGTGFPASGAPGVVVMRSPGFEPDGPLVFGDGLRCVGDTGLTRLGATVASGGASAHVLGHGAGAGPGLFLYQAWFRNQPTMFCDPAAAFNTSNGLALHW